MADLYRVDLLRERRKELGLPEPVFVDSASLLRKGVLLGSVPAVLVALAMVGLGLQLFLTSRAADQLESVHNRYQQLEARLEKKRSSLKSLEKSSQQLADQILALPASSALLSAVSAVTPAGVQILSLQEQDETFTLKGAASEPYPFARIESLILNLSKLALFEADSIRLVKATGSKQESQSQAAPAQAPASGSNQQALQNGRIPVGGGSVPQSSPAAPPPGGQVAPAVAPVSAAQAPALIDFEITGSFTGESAKEISRQLVELGAQGKQKRYLQLQKLGLLQ